MSNATLNSARPLSNLILSSIGRSSISTSPRRENAVFSNSLVLCLLLYQRICPDKSVELVVKKLLESAPKLLPAHHKRVREGTLSSDPSGYAKARKKCPLKAVQKVAQTVSETSLVDELLQQLPDDSVVMADAGFGIFSVAWTAQQRGHDFLLRLTGARFKSHLRKATRITQRGNVTTYTLLWRPSKKERTTHPDIPADAQLAVQLHAIRITDTLTLYLVTNLTADGARMAELYQHRNDAEIDIRNFKVVLSAETSRVRSKEMFLKELWMSLVSYNLVCQFRREAAQQASLKPRELSFKRVLSTFEVFLLSRLFKSASEARSAFARALKIAMKDKLPHRPDRHYEREAYQRRPKSAQFKKRPINP